MTEHRGAWRAAAKMGELSRGVTMWAVAILLLAPRVGLSVLGLEAAVDIDVGSRLAKLASVPVRLGYTWTKTPQTVQLGLRWAS